MAVNNYSHIKNKNILDFGCGYGRMSRWLIEEGADSVIGLDTNEKMIMRAKKDGETLSLKFMSGDILDFSENKSFDMILCCWVLQHIVDENYLLKVLQKLRKLLKSNGQFILMERIRSENEGELEKGMPDNFIRKRTLNDYERLLNQTGFKIIRWQPFRLTKQHLLITIVKKIIGERMWLFKYIARLDIWMRRKQKDIQVADAIFECRTIKWQKK